MQNKIKEIFPQSVACINRWNYPVISLGRNEYRNCCRVSRSIATAADLKAMGTNIILNSEIEREARARMLLGERLESCSSCWQIEEKNVRSPRIDMDFPSTAESFDLAAMQSSLSQLSGHQEKVKFLSSHQITLSKQASMLEIILNNTCDMQCMYCSHHYSTKWANERIKYGEISPAQMAEELPKPNHDFKKILIEWFKAEGFKTVNYINFIGGEPALISDFYEVSREITEIVRAQAERKITLSVVTNLNSRPEISEKFLSHLEALAPYYDSIDLNISQEAFGAKAEYIRYGLDWHRWQANFEKVANLKVDNLKISLQLATNLLSISSLPQLLEYIWTMFETKKIAVNLRQNLVSTPRAHSPMLLTPNFARYFDQAINFLRERAAAIDPYLDSNFGLWRSYAIFLNSIKLSIKSHELNFEEMKTVRDFFNVHNQRKQINIYEIFPEYEEFFRTCGVESYRKHEDLNPTSSAKPAKLF